jgi:hypothetical protein
LETNFSVRLWTRVMETYRVAIGQKHGRGARSSVPLNPIAAFAMSKITGK